MIADESGPLIALEGWYGHGNLGDDLLMLVAHSIAREAYPASRFVVRSTGRSYIHTLIQDDFAQEDDRASRRPACVRILGGGGLFFDFNGESGVLLNARIRLLRLLGVVPYWRIHNFARKFLLRSSNTRYYPDKRTIALGVGIGPFASGSRRELETALLLHDFEVVAVRDLASACICRSWRLPGHVIEGSDLVFLHERWLPNGVADSPVPGHTTVSPRVSCIVRDWPTYLPGAQYLTSLRLAVRELRSQGIQVRYVSFNPENDTESLRQLLTDGENVLCWEADRGDLSGFLRVFAQTDVIVTSRAHGAIVGACLGIPSVCIGIEPKLRNVAKMIPAAAALWEPPFAPSELLAHVQDVLSQRARDPGAVIRERERNRRAASDMARQVVAYIRSSF